MVESWGRAKKGESEKREHVVVFITATTAEEAQKIANILVSERKAACVNIVPQVYSRFWWQGKIDSADEALLIVKTKAARLDELIGLVKENHSYEVPEIVALPIVGGNPDYLQWLDDETK
ncbi:MAG: divalent-cation tolerance protein CutA [Dehalococcoidia bacterium]|nr:divalent-cation tolerance protein CutA [Dehalococcoidia bacterium]